MKHIVVFFILFILPTEIFSNTSHTDFVVELALVANTQKIQETFVRYQVAKIDTIEISIQKFDTEGRLSSKYLKDNLKNIRSFTNFSRDEAGEIIKIQRGNFYAEYYTHKNDTLYINMVTPRGDTLKKCVKFGFGKNRDSVFIERCVSRFGDVDSTVRYYRLATGEKVKTVNFHNSNLATKRKLQYDKHGNITRIITNHYAIQDNEQSFLQSVISAREIVETRGYSVGGKLTEIILRESGTTNKILYEYDNQGKLVKIQHINENAPNVIKKFHYDNFQGKMLPSRVVVSNSEGLSMGDYFYTYLFHE